LVLKKETIIKHAKLAFEIKGKKGIVELRKHLLAYFKGHPRAKKLRKKFVRVEDLDDIISIITKI